MFSLHLLAEEIKLSQYLLEIIRTLTPKNNSNTNNNVDYTNKPKRPFRFTLSHSNLYHITSFLVNLVNMAHTYTHTEGERERVKLRESESTFQRPHTHNVVVIVRENWVTLSMFIHCGKQRKGLMLCKQIIYSISSEMVCCDGNGCDSGSYSIIKASLSLPSMLPSSLLRNGRQNICFFSRCRWVVCLLSFTV